MPSIKFDVNDVKPLLSTLQLGQAPPPPPDMSQMAPPPPPQATPAVAGFNEWSSDPMNQQKVGHAITPPGQPIIPPDVRAQATQMASLTPPPTPNFASLAGPPAMPAAPAIKVQPTPDPNAGLSSKLNADQAELQRLQSTGSGVSQIKNRGLRIAARIGDAAGTVLAPGVMSAIPGTTVHNWTLQNLKQGQIAGDQSALKDAANLQDIQSQTEQRSALANKANAQADAVGDPAVRRAKDIAAAAKIGAVPQYDEKGNLTGYAPDENSQIYQKNQALMQLQSARTEAAAARADLDKSKNDPKSPAFQQAQSRLRVAQQNATTAAQRLGLSAQEFQFNQDKFYNPQPTAAERGKGDLAQSAVERVQEMKQIVKAHPEWFGPVEGRISNVQAAIGSQDADMQRYLSAAQYLSDHSAGVFGGRGKYITEQLHALTDPKMNTDALGGALDEAEAAAKGFVKAGTVHGKGGTSSYSGGSLTPPPAGGVEEYVRVNGKLVKKGGK